jgi:hypothetical protein
MDEVTTLVHREYQIATYSHLHSAISHPLVQGYMSQFRMAEVKNVLSCIKLKEDFRKTLLQTKFGDDVSGSKFTIQKLSEV